MTPIRLSCPSCGAQLEIPPEIEQFACASCGAALKVQRTGGIIALALAGETEKEREIRALEKELEEAIQFQMLDVPAYTLLRFDFLQIRKVHNWDVRYVNTERLEKIFRNLTIPELEKVISFYSKNPNSPTAAWLNRVKDLRLRLAELKK